MLLLAHFLGFAYAFLAAPVHAARGPYALITPSDESPSLAATYGEYLGDLLRRDLGPMPGSPDGLAETLTAALGASLGLLGLALTGWAETAQVVREQTRVVRAQPDIEAARAVGESGPRILFRHVLRQLMPMMWMLLALEIGSTLLGAASLGFMGYSIGGGTWMQVDDFLAQNAIELPELGQLLSAYDDIMFTRPGGILAIGTVIFLSVLGFNLLGEGLRRRLSPEHIRRGGALLPGRMYVTTAEGHLYAIGN